MLVLCNIEILDKQVDVLCWQIWLLFSENLTSVINRYSLKFIKAEVPDVPTFCLSRQCSNTTIIVQKEMEQLSSKMIK